MVDIEELRRKIELAKRTFELDKLKSAFLAELEIHGFSEGDFALSWDWVKELAEKVMNNKIPQVEAVKQAMMRATKLAKNAKAVAEKAKPIIEEIRKAVKEFDCTRQKVYASEEFSEGVAEHYLHILDDIAKKLRKAKAELENLFSLAPLKELQDAIDEADDVLEEIKALKKEIRERTAKASKEVRDVLERLKSVFTAQLELAGWKKNEIEREWLVYLPEMEKLAEKVVTGSMTLQDAIRVVVSKLAPALKETTPSPSSTQAPPTPAEVGLVKPEVEVKKLLKEWSPIAGVETIESELGRMRAMTVLPSYFEQLGEEVMKRHPKALLSYFAGYVLKNAPVTLAQGGVEKALDIKWGWMWQRISRIPLVEALPEEVKITYKEHGKEFKETLTKQDLIADGILYTLCKILGVPEDEIPPRWRATYRWLMDWFAHHTRR